MIQILRDLYDALPALELLGQPDRVEEQARAVLRLVIQPILETNFQAGAPVPVDPATCPNCSKPASGTKTPYCGAECRNEAAFVRQFRGAVVEKTIFDSERQEGIGQVFWYLVGGGRPLRQHIIPEKTKQDLFKKAGGKCTICGDEATSIDHIASGCNRPINLQAVCDSCCRAKPFGDSSVLQSHECTVKLKEFSVRIGSPEAIRCCDDPKHWDWRAYVKAREALARAS